MSIEKVTTIIGLGNKDTYFENTRHNFGKDFLIWIAQKNNLSWKKKNNFLFTSINIENSSKFFFLIIPLTYMNESGKIIKHIFPQFATSASNLLIIHDDLEIPFSYSKIRFDLKRGHHGHNGIKSFLNEFNKNSTDKPLYMSLGIGRPTENIKVSDFVLKKFSNNEIKLMENLFNKFYSELKSFLL